MPLPLIIAGVGAGLSALGGAIGKIFGDADRATQEKWLQSAMDEYGNIDVPALKDIIATQQGPSAMEQVTTDPRLYDAQMAALTKLQGIQEGGGRNLEMAAAENRALNDVARKNAAGQNNILESMRARGVGGSGAELAMQQANAQASADRNADIGMDSAARAEGAYFDSILKGGQLGGQMQDRQFNQRSQQAQAKDLVSRYNTGLRSQAQYHNAALPNQQFQNRMALADRRAGAKKSMAGLYGDKGKANQEMWGGMGGALGDAATSVGGYYAQQPQQRGIKRDDDDLTDRERAFRAAGGTYTGGY